MSKNYNDEANDETWAYLVNAKLNSEDNNQTSAEQYYDSMEELELRVNTLESSVQSLKNEIEKASDAKTLIEMLVKATDHWQETVDILERLSDIESTLNQWKAYD